MSVRSRSITSFIPRSILHHRSITVYRHRSFNVACYTEFGFVIGGWVADVFAGEVVLGDGVGGGGA